MIKLRSYQNDLIGALRESISNGSKRIVLCAPTGGGKTICFTYMVTEHLKRGGQALILTDRIELLKQAGGTFSKFGLSPEEIKAGHQPDLTRSCHVAMIETLYRRAEKYKAFLSSRTMVIIDESHRTAFNKITKYFSDECVVIGCTATPFRSGSQPSMDEYYQDLVQPVDTPDLIELGYLSEATTYGVDIDLKGVKKRGGDWDTNQMAERFKKNKVYKGVIENYNRLTPNTKTLAFAANIESSKDLVAELKAAGLPAVHLDSEMSKSERESILSWFNRTPNGILCNIGILTTGFDQPDIKTIILYRATTSLPLFLQMVGRGSRIIPGEKSSFTILDFGNNIKTHDFWESPREWTLEKKAARKKDVAPVKSCPKCQALLPVSTQKCQYCGHKFVKTEKQKEEEETARLVLLPKPQRLAMAREVDIQTKAAMAKAGAIKAAWVLHNLTDRNEAMEFVKAMGYKNGWMFYNKDRFAVFSRDAERN